MTESRRAQQHAWSACKPLSPLEDFTQGGTLCEPAPSGSGRWAWGGLSGKVKAQALLSFWLLWPAAPAATKTFSNFIELEMHCEAVAGKVTGRGSAPAWTRTCTLTCMNLNFSSVIVLGTGLALKGIWRINSNTVARICMHRLAAGVCILWIEGQASKCKHITCKHITCTSISASQTTHPFRTRQSPSHNASHPMWLQLYRDHCTMQMQSTSIGNLCTKSTSRLRSPSKTTGLQMLSWRAAVASRQHCSNGWPLRTAGQLISNWRGARTRLVD